jgi:hypothetical protein
VRGWLVRVWSNPVLRSIVSGCRDLYVVVIDAGDSAMAGDPLFGRFSLFLTEEEK